MLIVCREDLLVTVCNKSVLRDLDTDDDILEEALNVCKESR